MVEQYNARADAQGLEPHEMRAVCTLAELGAEDRFDLIVCSMAYHHFAAVDEVSRELVKYLKPGGTLAVADIADADTGQPSSRDRDSDGGVPPLPPLMAGYEHIVAHTSGFSEEVIRALFVGTGLEDVSFELFTSAKRQGRDVHFFLATGTRATAIIA
jgi:SAM-dependent methyltransferase